MKKVALLVAVQMLTLVSTSLAVVVTNDMIASEARRLEQQRRQETEKCMNHAGCVNKHTEAYKRNMKKLQDSPEQYFYEQERRQLRMLNNRY